MTASTATVIPPVSADDRFDGLRRYRPLIAYDEGLAAPPRPADGPGADLVDGSVDDVIEVVTGQCQVLMAKSVANRTIA